MAKKPKPNKTKANQTINCKTKPRKKVSARGIILELDENN